MGYGQTDDGGRWQDHSDQRLEREEAEEEDELPEEDAEFSPKDHDMESLLRDVQEDMNL